MRFISQAQKMVNAAFNIFSDTTVLKLHCIPVCTDVYNPTIIHCFQNSVRMRQYLIKLGIYIFNYWFINVNDFFHFLIVIVLLFIHSPSSSPFFGTVLQIPLILLIFGVLHLPPFWWWSFQHLFGPSTICQFSKMFTPHGYFVFMSSKIKFCNFLLIITNCNFANQISGMAFTGKINNNHLIKNE
jgi:hypothetical protein